VVEWMEGGWYHFARKAAVNWRLEKSGQGGRGCVYQSGVFVCFGCLLPAACGCLCGR
jgi:hypothetical protein